jgi:tripartite-type tricarboxylate transporter receptor subunit TctC
MTSITAPRRRRVLLGLPGLTLLGLSGPGTSVLAQPSASARTDATSSAQPVRIISALPAGSGPDVALRVVAERLGRRWDRSVVVDNRPGGNGFIAIQAMRAAAPDGLTLAQLDSHHLTTHPHTFARLPYDPVRDLEPVAPLLRNSFFIVVAKDSPVRTLDDLIDRARAQPGRLTYGSWFNGSPGHLGALRLQQQLGLEMLHVPYRETAMLYAAVAAREVDWALGSAATAGALERSGKLRFIALAGPARSPLYPDVPTTGQTRQAGGFTATAWTGLFAPAGTSMEVRERMSRDVRDVLAQPDVQARFRELDYERPSADPQSFARQIAEETRAWGTIIRSAGLRLD